MEKLVGGLPDDLVPGALVAYACFGTWENASTCIRIDEADDPFDGCSQSVECRRYTLERNPPTTRFDVKPRRDGRFEIQQFRDFIGTNTTYQLDIKPGEISITFPGDRSVPKSRRFFLHVKHVEEAELSLEKEFELVMTLEKMLLHQASEGAQEQVVVAPARAHEDAEARRKRIAERLKNRASEAASSVDIDDDLDFDIDLDDLDDEAVPEKPAEEVELDEDTVASSDMVKEGDEDDDYLDIDDFEDVDISDDLVPDSDLDDEDRIPEEEDDLDDEAEEGEDGEESSEAAKSEGEGPKARSKKAKDDVSPKAEKPAKKGKSTAAPGGGKKKQPKAPKATATKKKTK